MTHSTSRLPIDRGGVAPAVVAARLLHFDPIAHAPHPVPAELLHCPEPGPAEPGIGDQDRTAARRQHLRQRLQETLVGARTVVSGQPVHFLVQRDRTPADRQRGGQHQPRVAGLAIGPIDQDHRTLDPYQQPLRQCLIDLSALAMQVSIAEQPIDAFALVLGAALAAERATEMGQGQDAAEQQSFDRRQQARGAGTMDE